MSSSRPIALTSQTKVRVSPRVYAREFGGEIVLLDFGVGEYFGLDEVGAEVWRRLEGGEALPDIADRIVERFDVSRDVALGDVIALVTEMCTRSLVETV
jgi:hypothetical protein